MNFVTGCIEMIPAAFLAMLPILVIGGLLDDMSPAFYLGVFYLLIGGILGVVKGEQQ